MNKYKFENYGINEIIERKNIYSFLNISAYDEILILVEWTVIQLRFRLLKNLNFSL